MNTETYKRRLTAILSADVVGYSRLMGEDEPATVRTITNYRRAIRDLIEQHRGRMVDSPGDNVLAEFASVVDAAQCAVAVQKEIQSRNRELPEARRMHFRIGINLGDVIEEGDRIYGDGVNIAARLEALADPGGICISKTAFDHIETKLPLGYEYIGEQVVKNIARPVTAYKVLMDPRIIGSAIVKQKRSMPPWSKKAALISGISLMILFMALGTWRFYLGGRITKRALGGRASIVVLPFTPVGQDSLVEQFSDGITEELISALAKEDDLQVISRTSAYSYKGKDVDLRTVGKQLKVNNVLEGSVRKSGNKLRVTVQLIKVADDMHLWSETYDRESKEGFVVQDEITRAAVKRVKMELLGPEDRRPLHDYAHRYGVNTIVNEEEKIEGGLTAMGANVEVSGTIHGGLEIFGANIIVSGKNQGDLRVFGANVFLSGEFLDVVEGVAATLTISGVFEDDLEVRAGKIIIEPTAVIKGDLAYSAGLFERREGSRIMGKVVDLETQEGKAWMETKHQYEKKPEYLAKGIFWVISTLAIILVGLGVHTLLPKQTEAVVSALSGSIWKSLGFGLGVLVITPLCIIISFFTVIGIPAGIMGLFLYITMIYISRVYVGLWIGRKLLAGFKESSAPFFFWPFVTGTMVMGVLWIIPVLGWIMKIFFLLIGLGAVGQELWRAIHNPARAG